MGGDLYDTDILTWSEHQADLLRQIAAGGRPNEPPDWSNIMEEVADVGRNALRACRSLLLQALLHDLKAERWPMSRDVEHWRLEARLARVNAADAFTPSMRQHIDVQALYTKALSILPPTLDGQLPLPVATRCPLTLDELLRNA